MSGYRPFAVLLAVLLGTEPTMAAAGPPVRDDTRLSAAVRRARASFLATQPFDRMHVTVLAVDRDGVWRRGHVEGDRLAYPASCVKLAFMVAAVNWCAARGATPDCLDGQVRPMITESDNVAAGEVVDAVTGVRNVVEQVDPPAAGQGFEAWLDRRRRIERALADAGLLGPQRLLTKTYPTNSGEVPTGYERVLRERLGPNQMTANDAARLMLAIVTGEVEPQGREYMRSLLRRPRVSPHSGLGGGLPAGAVHENKLGTAFDTLEDIMYAEIAGGRRVIVAAFTNGWDQREAEPWDVARLGRFTELLLQELRWNRGNGRPLYRRASQGAWREGRWHPADSRGALTRHGYLESSGHAGDALRWSLGAGRSGRFEVAVWYPLQAGRLGAADYTIVHAGGETRVRIDQRSWGSRWITLGTFSFVAEKAFVSVASVESLPIAADTLRLTPVAPATGGLH